MERKVWQPWAYSFGLQKESNFVYPISHRMTIFSEPKMTGFGDEILEFLGRFDDMRLIE